MARQTAVILVNLHAQAGRCSNCGERAYVARTHECGARVIGVAINAHIAARPSRAQADRVIDLCSSIRFLGVGVLDWHEGRPQFSLVLTYSQLR